MVASQDTPRSVRQFILRLWPEDLGHGRVEWRGKLQHVPRGDVYYFRTWDQLVQCLRVTLEEDDDQLV